MRDFGRPARFAQLNLHRSRMDAKKSAQRWRMVVLCTLGAEAAMNLLLLLALALPLGCLALLSLLAFLGVLAIAGALHVVGAIKIGLGLAGRGSADGGQEQWRGMVRDAHPEQVKKAGRSARVVLVNVVVASTISVVLLPWRPAQSQDPHERTARGVMTEQVRKVYSDSIEACYQEAGRAARGPAFLDCLKRQVRSEEAALDAVYNARIAYLGSLSELAATLRNAQTAWLHFRDANCAYIRAVERAHADESFQDCVLRSTVSRRVELRWSVGD
jgi:uncharacterized protein YecT (DUF1311 family)